jgi:hypothetical protein
LLIDTNQPLWARRQQLEAGAAVDVYGRSMALWELQPLKSLKTDQDEALAEFVTGASIRFGRDRAKGNIV